MNLPIDWPRINQFPEWFVAESDQEYKMVDYVRKKMQSLQGSDMIDGLDIRVEGEQMLLVY